jgi:hypothetical protein
MREMSKDNLLRSWKDISAHLGCDTRTCHRWEKKHGMPVHRMEGGETKSPVFAYKDELDSWFQEIFRNSNMSRVNVGHRRAYLKWLLAELAVVVIVAAFFLVKGSLERRQPADFAVKGSVLIVRDEEGRELWKKDTKMEDLQPEAFYRANFQVMHRDAESDILPSLIIKDINNDGDTEVLFAPKRIGSQTGEGWLYCYDRKGTELWKFHGGKELVCGGKVYSPDYRIAGFYCHDVDGDGRLETFIESFQAPDWPCQLAVLDASGKKIGEFWNAGYLRQLAFHDLDGDGREELIVVGVNNEFRGGCLVVFDTRRISGSSPQSGRFVCEGLEPGSELYYVTVPYTDVSEAMGIVVAGFSFIEITENERIRATYLPSLFYEFGFDLKCLQVDWGHDYEYRHGEMAEAGKLTSVLGDPYRANLLAAVRYWNGSAWTAEPARNRS